MSNSFRGNIKGTFSAVAASANDNDGELSPQSIAIARAGVISEMGRVLDGGHLPVPYQMIILSAIADFGREDAAGLVRAHAMDRMTAHMTPSSAATVNQSVAQFLTERMAGETDVNIRQDAVSRLADAAACEFPGVSASGAATALAVAARNDSEHDVRAMATQGLGRIVLENPKNIDVLEAAGVIADVARDDENRYVRWSAAHMVKRILMSDVANQIPVGLLAQRLTGQTPVKETADIPGQIVATIEAAALEESANKAARKRPAVRVP